MILLCGSNGYLGRHLIAQSAPDLLITTSRQIERVHHEFTHYPSRDDADIAALPWESIDSVINVAGRVTGDDVMLNEANVDFALKMAATARFAGVRRFVQVSSFSVFGLTETIGAATPVKPVTPYGRSKLKCDEGLAALRTNRFEPVSVRLPFMFDQNRPSFLGPLLRMCATFSIWPSTAAGVRRSMMNYGDAARTLFHVAREKRVGQVAAASPEEFDYPLLARLVQEEANRSLRSVQLPNVTLQGLAKFAPGTYRRMFQSSILLPEINIASTVPGIVGIEPALRLLVKRYYLHNEI